MFEELETFIAHDRVGGFLPAMKQISNVAALPGIVRVCLFFFVFDCVPCVFSVDSVCIIFSVE
jgi:hypothetical protein